MGAGARPERVAEEFREVLAEEIPQLKDPRVGFVTVTRVEVTPDLRKAIVYYTVMGQDRDHRRTRAGLNSAKAHLRSVLGQQVRMKFTPDLEFEEDVGLAQVERVTELLKQISTTDDSEPSGDGKAAE
ncbi:MAG TPA: 30S ribosome-binding factor RbfA [Actinomycetota bacterium]|jgi:ribosome-binding factor A|nr:30S ribosome-binding factor RbfA [Actinomycetota bacterium]